MDLELALSHIRPIPDYPKAGILFQDITPLLANADAFEAVIREIASLDPYSEIAVGIEARGFILASALSIKKGIGFVPLRKKGKLPSQTYSRSYGLEYGSDELEIHRDALNPGMKVTLVDDVLATGGTIEAAIQLIEDAGGEITSIVVLLEIEALSGREKITQSHPHIPLYSLEKK